MKLILIAMLTIFIFAVTGICSQEPASKHVDYVSYSNLWAHADLVIIGRATTARDTGVRMEMNDHHQVVSCEKWETRFNVRLVLKGQAIGDQITLLHFQQPKDSKPFCWFGPKLARFELAPEQFAGGFHSFAPAPRPEYMLFLRNDENGHYVPVSGQMNSDFSVREVYGLQNKPRRENPQP